MLTSCGAARSGSFGPEPAEITSTIEATGTTTTAIVADRSVPTGEERWWCSLERVVVDASAAVRVTVDPSVPLRTWSDQSEQDAYSGLVTPSTFDAVWVDPPADHVTASVTEVVAARVDDLRGPAAPVVGTHQLVQLLRGSVLPELWESGDEVVALVGPWGVDGDPAWRAHAALTERPDGSLEFLGACAHEFTGALATVAEAESPQPDLTMLTDLMSGALEPGAAADLAYHLHGWGWSEPALRYHRRSLARFE